MKNDLIVKIKDEQSKYFKLKAEVRDVNYKDKILVRVLNESRDKVYFKESDLSKVLPSEGGRVLILNSNKIGKVLEIDMKRSEVYVRDDESGNKSWHKFNEVCKINL